jgi:RNA polymerase-binding transcription factor DksA
MNERHLRGVLIADQTATQELMAELGHDIEVMVAARQGGNNDDEHDPEGVTLAFERSQTEALARQAAERLTEIGAAIARLDGGTYGVCESCGNPIAPARLEARPAARTCINCA